MITDGVPGIDSTAAEAASRGIQTYGATMFLICITPGCTEDWAKAVASKPRKGEMYSGCRPGRSFRVELFGKQNNAACR